MDDAGVAQATGLPLPEAALARARQFSEPGTWAGDDATRETFLAALADQGITARMGGRFLTLSHGATKADRMAEIIDTLQPARTVALGDAPNDVEMLQAADIGVIVANPEATPLPELPNEQAGRIIRTHLPGPQGWNRAMLDILSDGKTG
jgi:mannosyl-3-phosphoglycerate phosphatase